MKTTARVLGLCAALVMPALPALAEGAAGSAAPEQHSVREADPPTGSMLRRKLTESKALPINKTYEQLTPEEKESLNQAYEQVGPGDEPPFPLHGLRPIHLAMAKLQQKLQVAGDLILIATVDPEGNVTQVKAIGSPDPEMTRYAATVLSFTKFKPALCLGVPCRMDYPFAFHFSME